MNDIILIIAIGIICILFIKALAHFSGDILRLRRIVIQIKQLIEDTQCIHKIKNCKVCSRNEKKKYQIKWVK